MSQARTSNDQVTGLFDDGVWRGQNHAPLVYSLGSELGPLLTLLATKGR
jgi:hypothetical protein